MLKAKHEAKLREAAEKKALRDQERRERRKCEKREKREKEEQEEREHQELRSMADRERRVEGQVLLAEEAEVVIGPLQEAWKAAAEKARRRIEARAWAETERIWAAMHWMQEDVGAAMEVVGSEGVTDGPRASETEEGSETGQKPSRRRVVTSRQNTAEVVIVRPPKTGRGPAEDVGKNQVSGSYPPLRFGELTLNRHYFLTSLARSARSGMNSACPRGGSGPPAPAARNARCGAPILRGGQSGGTRRSRMLKGARHRRDRGGARSLTKAQVWRSGRFRLSRPSSSALTG